MKNFVKIIAVVAILAAAVSCKEHERATATFYLGTTFDLAENDISTLMIDSLLYSPSFAWDDVMTYYSICSGMNEGYRGGMVLSARFGSGRDSDERSMLASGNSESGALGSLCYMVYKKTESMPKYDIEFDYSAYHSVTPSISGCYVCNTQYIRRMAARGELEHGDFLKVTIEFLNAGTSMGSLKLMLVDYTGSELKMLNDWTVWDMAEQMKDENVSVPRFDAIRFNVETSRTNIPPCFCLDNFLVQLSVEY